MTVLNPADGAGSGRLQDATTLMAECATPDAALESAISATFQLIYKLKVVVKLVAAGTLPNNGRVIADGRPVT